MKKVLIFGGGRYGRALINKLLKYNDVEIVGILDNYLKGNVEGIPVFNPCNIGNLQYDYILLALDWVDEAVQQLWALGVDYFKINTSFLMDKGIGARNLFIKNFAEEINRNCEESVKNACVAEAGVYKGTFAAIINEVFSDRKIYLFDTFAGFDEEDIRKEAQMEKAENSLNTQKYFNETSESIVIKKMPYPQNVIIKKGYVPETFAGIDENFCFVNLDMDLYQPTLRALEWFWPRVILGGGILCHDFYNDYTFPNVKKAVIEFTQKEHIQYFPIGDGMSIFIPKVNK